jgi:hypothetical protein
MAEKSVDLDQLIASRGGDQNNQSNETAENSEATNVVEKADPENSDEKTESEETNEVTDVVEKADSEESAEKTTEKSESEESAGNAESAEVDTGNSEIDLNEFEFEGKPVAEYISEAKALSERIAKIENDPFLKKFIAHYEATGDARKFLDVQTVNWEKKTDLEVLRENLVKEFSDLPSDIIEDAVVDKITKQYGLNPFEIGEDEKDSKQARIALATIKRDADRLRAQFKKEQEEFTIPEPKKVQAPNFEELKAKVVAEDQVKDLIQSKLVKLGVADADGKPLAYSVKNPESLVEMAVDERKFWSQFVDANKKIDWARVNRVLAYSQDPVAFEKAVFDMGKRAGAIEKAKIDRNTDGRLNKSKTGAGDESGDFKTGFLKALKTTGKKRNF